MVLQFSIPAVNLTGIELLAFQRTLLRQTKSTLVAAASPDQEAETSGFDLVANQMQKSNVDKFDELRTYLSFPVVDPSKCTNVLTWWKENEKLLPAVSTMARDYLAVSATGVPIERKFAFGSDLLKPKTLSLAADSIGKRFRLKAWGKYKLEGFETNRMRAIAKTMYGCK
ncbi:unnamed protein product [Allacma fusca]|uniref:HAT C-terminal dimerisation domain-containing protein n=1 Tax=Allacma fusca TaxID=39272 RepID=A0A8J2JWK8_9HEXA|nr:unnamed protein product [Allacma fusca]